MAPDKIEWDYAQSDRVDFSDVEKSDDVQPGDEPSIVTVKHRPELSPEERTRRKLAAAKRRMDELGRTLLNGVVVLITWLREKLEAGGSEVRDAVFTDVYLVPGFLCFTLAPSFGADVCSMCIVLDIAHDNLPPDRRVGAVRFLMDINATIIEFSTSGIKTVYFTCSCTRKGALLSCDTEIVESHEEIRSQASDIL